MLESDLVVKGYRLSLKRYSQEQIVWILDEIRSGKSISSVSREYIVSQYYPPLEKQVWRDDKSKFIRSKELESENAQLKDLLAEQDLDNSALKSLLEKYS